MNDLIKETLAPKHCLGTFRGCNALVNNFHAAINNILSYTKDCNHKMLHSIRQEHEMQYTAYEYMGNTGTVHDYATTMWRGDTKGLGDYVIILGVLRFLKHMITTRPSCNGVIIIAPVRDNPVRASVLLFLVMLVKAHLGCPITVALGPSDSETVNIQRSMRRHNVAFTTICNTPLNTAIKLRSKYTKPYTCVIDDNATTGDIMTASNNKTTFITANIGSAYNLSPGNISKTCKGCYMIRPIMPCIDDINNQVWLTSTISTDENVTVEKYWNKVNSKMDTSVHMQTSRAAEYSRRLDNGSSGVCNDCMLWQTITKELARVSKQILV